MQHIGEHTLELYVLKAGEIADRIDDIEAHLQECSGCQALVSEMSKFYDDLTVELERMPEVEISPEKALVRRNVHLNPIFERNTPAFRYRPSTPLAKIFYFVRRHPVSVGLGSFALVAAFGWWMNSATDSLSSFFKDKNPEKFLYDSGSNSIVVLNKNGEKLWGLPLDNVARVKDKMIKFNTDYTLLEDLDNDGKKELVTTVSTPLDKALQARFRIFDYKGKSIVDKPLNQPFDYLNNKLYSYDFDAGPILIYQPVKNEKKEIFVGAHNIGHSPYFIGRYDCKGQDIGKYWHFGTINGIRSLDWNGDGKNEIIAYGQNDSVDKPNTDLAYAIVTVLDPLKIVGEKQSRLAGGFNFNFTDAELLYIKFPLTDINLKLHATSSILAMEKVALGNIRITYEIATTDGDDRPEIYFTFTKDLRILEVKSSDYFDKYHSQFVKRGTLKVYNPDKYFKDLKNGVRYWDGKVWSREWTGVKYNH